MIIEEHALILNKQLTSQNTTNVLNQDTLNLNLGIVFLSLSSRIINQFAKTQLCFQNQGRGIFSTVPYHIVYLYHHSMCPSSFSSSSLTKRFAERVLLMWEGKSENTAYTT